MNAAPSRYPKAQAVSATASRSMRYRRVIGELARSFLLCIPRAAALCPVCVGGGPRRCLLLSVPQWDLSVEVPLIRGGEVLPQWVVIESRAEAAAVATL